ncbi:MAG TPA: tRNA (adenosine(37)-N6)-threonylcarbamoyltransferase complex dimerization subunit type 1 TsaB [Patescibacteria group bacterium]|nr:tRNA (adenosine(37)-N6)-threonylcarbamoyltransferase complex dimerization subunit type 1 TsaB [Patescibacteria group bacterium]
MPILALDTATIISSVALATQDTILAELTLQTSKTHSERLLPHIAEMLEMAGVQRRELQAVAVSIGPGSYTGLRIGLGTAKALAYALKIPLIGVPTLAALAHGCPVPGVFYAPMLDAQKEQVYLGLYDWYQGGLREREAARVLPVAEALPYLHSLTQPVVLMGEGAVMYRQMAADYAPQLMIAPPHTVMPRAANIALLGWKMLQEGYSSDVFSLEPLYMRRSEAEELWERRQGGCS